MNNLNLIPYSFLLLLLLFSLATSTETASSSHVTSNQIFQDIACSLVDCGQGTCQASNNSLLGFDCLCKPGWKKIQIGPFTFPSCLIPNCTVDFHCGQGSPSPPPAPAIIPPFNFSANQSSHCAFVWCGDGNCVSNGSRHICECHQGSENLFNSSSLACFKPCYFGADCEALGLNFPIGNRQPPPSPPPLPATSNSPNSYGNGLKRVSSCSGTLCELTVIVLVAACIAWF